LRRRKREQHRDQLLRVTEYRRGWEGDASAHKRMCKLEGAYERMATEILSMTGDGEGEWGEGP